MEDGGLYQIRSKEEEHVFKVLFFFPQYFFRRKSGKGKQRAHGKIVLFGSGKKDSAFVKEHLFKITISIYFCLKCDTAMENQTENLYLLSPKIFSFDLVFGSDRFPCAHESKQSSFYATLIFHNLIVLFHDFPF